MEHIAALLLIVGCSDDLSACKELPAPIPVYETSQDCEQQLQSSFKLYSGSYPQIYAQCIAVDPELEDTDADLVWNIRPDGTLMAAVEEPSVRFAGNEMPSGQTTTGERGDRVISRQ